MQTVLEAQFLALVLPLRECLARTTHAAEGLKVNRDYYYWHGLKWSMRANPWHVANLNLHAMKFAGCSPQQVASAPHITYSASEPVARSSSQPTTIGLPGSPQSLSTTADNSSPATNYSTSAVMSHPAPTPEPSLPYEQVTSDINGTQEEAKHVDLKASGAPH